MESLMVQLYTSLLHNFKHIQDMDKLNFFFDEG